MADNLPVNFPIPTETAIASYDYTDVEEGTGVVIYNGVKMGTGTAGNPPSVFTYALTRSTFSSFALPAARVLIEGASYDLDTTVFNSPRTVRGTAYVTGEFYFVAAAGGATITIQKVATNGSTTTNLSSAIYSGQANADGYAICVPLPLTTTLIKKGEKLRLHITLDDADGADLACDPTEEDGLAGIKLYMPFELKL